MTAPSQPPPDPNMPFDPAPQPPATYVAPPAAWQPQLPAPAVGERMPMRPESGLRPAVVVASVCLWIAYLAIDVLTSIGSLSSAPSNATQQGVFVGGVVVDIAMLVFTLTMATGRNWARIMLAICGSVRLLFLLIVLGAVANVIAVVLLPLLAAAFVTMFVPPANAWFALSGQVRRQPGIYPLSIGSSADTSHAPTGASGSNLGPATPDNASPPTVTPTTGRMPAKPSRRGWLIAAGLMALALIAGGVTWTLWPKTFTLNGSTEVNGSYAAGKVGEQCSGTGPASNVSEGANVTVYDSSGAIVANGSLGPGVGKTDPKYPIGWSCEFPYSFEVPAGSKFYSIEIGNAGGKLNYTNEQMRHPISSHFG